MESGPPAVAMFAPEKTAEKRPRGLEGRHFVRPLPRGLLDTGTAVFCYGAELHFRHRRRANDWEYRPRLWRFIWKKWSLVAVGTGRIAVLRSTGKQDGK